MLEGSVEWMHHRHLVAEARANIRQEMTDNAQQGAKDLAYLKQDEDRLTSDLKELGEIRSTHKWEHRSLTYRMEWSDFNDSAWKSARDTGALSYMDYQRVQRLADVYGKQDLVSTMAQRITLQEARALAPLSIAGDVDQTTDADLERMQEQSADDLMDIRILAQVLMQLNQQYAQTLKTI